MDATPESIRSLTGKTSRTKVTLGSDGNFLVEKQGGYYFVVKCLNEHGIEIGHLVARVTEVSLIEE